MGCSRFDSWYASCGRYRAWDGGSAGVCPKLPEHFLNSGGCRDEKRRNACWLSSLSDAAGAAFIWGMKQRQRGSKHSPGLVRASGPIIRRGVPSGRDRILRLLPKISAPFATKQKYDTKRKFVSGISGPVSLQYNQSKRPHPGSGITERNPP